MFTYGALTERLSGTTWSVKCVDCGDDIGTMTSEILMTAIRATAHKGGVKCPACRECSCDLCGFNVRWIDEVLMPMRNPNRDTARTKMYLRTCWVCSEKIAEDLPL